MPNLDAGSLESDARPWFLLATEKFVLFELQSPAMKSNYIRTEAEPECAGTI